MTGLSKPAPIREFEQVDADQFRDIRASGEPAVFRGLASNWPSVRIASEGDEALIAYLKRFPPGRQVQAIVGEPEIGGRFFYTNDMLDLNFKRGRSALEPFLDRLVRDRDNSAPLAMAVQSEPIPEVLPGFDTENRIELVPASAVPRAWIGNRIRVATHYDLLENVGVVVAGRRRFTLYPPDQLPNLYPGPLELTPAGAPVSLVDPAKPDLDRFPRYAEAAKTARTAELEPGDAIYIPYHWWHGVESLEPLNLFVNYWWNDVPGAVGRPYDALMYGFFALKNLPPDQREVWRMIFDYYIFCTSGDPAEHLPVAARGVLGEPTPELLHRMRITLKKILTAL